MAGPSASCHQTGMEVLAWRPEQQIEQATDFDVADVDLDGIADLIVARQDRPALILRGKTGGVPGPPEDLSTGPLYAVDASADLDLDGKLDLVSGGFVFLNRTDRGDPSHQLRFDVTQYALGGAYLVTVADINNDGAPDLISSTDYTTLSVVFNNACH